MNRSNMNSFDPNAWAESIDFTKLSNSVMLPLANRNYEGKIRFQGETVRVFENDDSTNKVQGVCTFYDPEEPNLLVSVDQRRYCCKQIKSITEIGKDKLRIQRDSYSMGISLVSFTDKYLLESLVKESQNVYPNEILIINSNNIVNFIKQMKKAFDDGNAPVHKRVAVVPSWFAKKLELSNLILDKSDNMFDTKGFLGKYGNFAFYESAEVLHEKAEWYQPVFFIKEYSITYAGAGIGCESVRTTDGDTVMYKEVFGSNVISPRSVFSCKMLTGVEYNPSLHNINVKEENFSSEFYTPKVSYTPPNI